MRLLFERKNTFGTYLEYNETELSHFFRVDMEYIFIFHCPGRYKQDDFHYAVHYLVYAKRGGPERGIPSSRGSAAVLTGSLSKISPGKAEYEKWPRSAASRGGAQFAGKSRFPNGAFRNGNETGKVLKWRTGTGPCSGSSALPIPPLDLQNPEVPVTLLKIKLVNPEVKIARPR